MQTPAEKPRKCSPWFKVEYLEFPILKLVASIDKRIWSIMVFASHSFSSIDLPRQSENYKV